MLDRLLAYDTSLPLDVRLVGSARRGGAIIDDITFAAAEGAPTAAYLVRPAVGEGPFAGVLFVHWYEPKAANSNRTQFLDEAVALAERGVVSLLVATIWSEPDWFPKRLSADDFAHSLRQAHALRRALDLLLAQPGVDPERIGYVGHDFGAMFGAVIAGVETRPRAYVLIAGAARFSDWYLFGAADGLPEGAALEAYRAQLAQIDPVTTLPQAQGSFLLQFGERDFYTPRQNFVAFYLATPAPSQIATYQAEHEMELPIIRHDRTVWLAEQLGL